MQLACYFAVIYPESTSDSEISEVHQAQTCGEVGKSESLPTKICWSETP